MPDIRKILVTLDFSEFGNLALPYGVALAQRFGAKLYACHVIDLPPTPVYGETVVDVQGIQQRMRDYADEQLEKLIGGYNVDWRALIGMGNPAEEVANLAEDVGADLVIAATHGRSGLQRLLLGSVTEQLMHTLTCPILVVRDFSFSPNKGFRKILVGVDFSTDSRLAVDYAKDLAAKFGAGLHLAHVIPPDFFKEWLKGGVHQGEDIEEGLRARLYEELTEMAANDQVEIEVLAGKPHEELIRHAEENDVDLIVLGVHGLGFVETLLVGSNTDRVIRMAHCPVLSVRPKPEAEE